MTEQGWQWCTATPHERGRWVREHRFLVRDRDQLCRIFSLTDEGARQILNGADWKPKYDDIASGEEATKEN